MEIPSGESSPTPGGRDLQHSDFICTSEGSYPGSRRPAKVSFRLAREGRTAVCIGMQREACARAV